ncbi:MAG TPA: metallophosphoesterase family protein, partial [Thermoleophilia bacterium]|nr:metallophosphoesterase family protein [Thermoleophilia bacterium]
AVEDTAAQIIWRNLPPVPHEVAAGPARVVVPGGAGPGAVVLDGLTPGTLYPLTLRALPAAGGPAAGGPAAGGPVEVGCLRTLEAPPGPVLSRFATVNDIHIGEQGGGPPFFISDPHPRPPGLEPYPLRCLRAAVTEAIEWGAELIVVKGDLTRAADPVEFGEVAEFLTSLPVPVEAVLGNHDVVDRGVDAFAAMTSRGVAVAAEPWARQLAGIRLIFGQTSLTHHKRGELPDEQVKPIVELAAAGGPCFVLIHHQLQRWRRPVYYPPGVPGPEARRFTEALAAANPDAIIASGHTHRTRTYRIGPLTTVEIGSTKDYPGVWAGYAVHEGGIRQVVRRVAAPDAISWTERSRSGVFGIWGRWAPGDLYERCFVQRWTRP